MKTQRQLIRIKKKAKKENHYNKPGLDSVAVLFLHSIKENICHQNRREIFKEYSGYEVHYWIKGYGGSESYRTEQLKT